MEINHLVQECCVLFFCTDFCIVCEESIILLISYQVWITAKNTIEIPIKCSRYQQNELLEQKSTWVMWYSMTNQNWITLHLWSSISYERSIKSFSSWKNNITSSATKIYNPVLQSVFSILCFVCKILANQNYTQFIWTLQKLE
jgi:hypothetical protein